MKYLLYVCCVLLIACGRGEQGSAGQAGSSCTVVQNAGSATVECSDGSTATVNSGATGTQGPSGQSCSATQVANGVSITCPGQSPVVVTNGPTGAAGANATPVTIVQLCPGTTVYASKFVEQALCIGNNLYGVYSYDNGFLTYLPPGEYTSNAINSTCNFTVKSNCVVEDN